MDTPKDILQKHFGEVRIEEFSAREYKDKLDLFADSPYKYGRRLLNGVFMPDDKGRCSSTPILGRVKSQQLKETPNIVSMTPGICSSFAIWPKVERTANDLFDACKRAILHPQFVFLALNWSTRLGMKKGAQEDCYDAIKFFKRQPRWSNFHTIRPTRGRNNEQTAKSRFLVDDAPLVKMFDNPIIRGAYLTDFVKGKVDSNSDNTYDYLEQQCHDVGEPWFKVFTTVLQNELKAFDNVFGIQRVPKFLVIFGSTLYNKLSALSQKYHGGKSLEELFPDRIVLRTGWFYSNRWQGNKEILNNLRKLYCPSAAGPFNVSDFRFKIEK